MKLQEWRREIDEIDGEIVALLERRAKVSRKIGVLKANAGLPIIDPGREEMVIRRINERNSGALPQESLARIYRRILQESRMLQAEAMGNVVKNGAEVR